MIKFNRIKSAAPSCQSALIPGFDSEISRNMNHRRPRELIIVLKKYTSLYVVDVGGLRLHGIRVLSHAVCLSFLQYEFVIPRYVFHSASHKDERGDYFGEIRLSYKY